MTVTQRSEPPGAAPADAAAPSFHTLPDIARRFRRLAAGIGADAFALFLLGPLAEGGRLLPAMDSDYPGLSELSRTLPARLPRRFGQQAILAGTPLAWAGAAPQAAMPALAGWSETVETAAATPGFALPLSTERGRPGVVVFCGAALRLAPDALFDLHAACHGLFAVVAGLRPAEDGAAPDMSKRERECLKMTANGHTSEEIAQRLGLSVHTANQYLANTTQKLNAVNRVHAVAKALRAGLID